MDTHDISFRSTTSGVDEQELEQLRRAVESRTVLGQATGMLAGQLSLTTGTAWHLLVSVSSLANLPVRTVADVLVASHDGTRAPADDAAAATVADALGRAVATHRRRGATDRPG